jgi:NAD(P)-dependent dehydrogenase (short-subunit alcohol dehydrogenase family)
MDVRAKTVLVTGGAKRVGRAICDVFADRGANVVIHYNRSEEEARTAVADLAARGVQALALRADLAVGAEAVALVGEAERRLGGVDVLVNSASVYFRTPLATLDEADWDRTLDTNLKGPFLCALHCGRAMQRRGAGKIVNIGDWAGIRPYDDYLPYCVSKAGIIALTKGLAKALAPQVQVNCVAPGPVLLPEDFTEEERRKVIQATPLKRLGSPEDVARTVLFLVEGTDFVTGATYLVDGGRLIA